VPEIRVTHVLSAIVVLSCLAVATPYPAAADGSTPAAAAPPVAPAELRPAAATTGSNLCSGSTHRRTLVRYDDVPMSGGMIDLDATDSQQITTKKSQGWETLVITFAAQTYFDRSDAQLTGQILVDGQSVEPRTSTQVLRSATAGWATVGLTGCVRVPPGVHQVQIWLDARPRGAHVDDYTVRIDQFA
jgi:hypothetical protein